MQVMHDRTECYGLEFNKMLCKHPDGEKTDELYKTFSYTAKLNQRHLELWNFFLLNVMLK